MLKRDTSKNIACESFITICDGECLTYTDRYVYSAKYVNMANLCLPHSQVMKKQIYCMDDILNSKSTRY